MTPTIRFCMVLHNHQPIGNFEAVFEQAYQDSYLPFLDVLDGYADLKVSLHTSGPLMEWLNQKHPEYIDRLGQMVSQQRVEIIGGPFYEPILAMIPSQDRVGQIRQYTAWLENHLGAHVQGMWVPERVWEQALTSDIRTAGIRYTVLDDYHFRNAGLSDDQLFGYYTTEDDGRLLSVFPGDERLRYLIPFAQPHESIEYLRELAQKHPGSVVVFGDDGEKFGTWPGTHKHVYQDGWLRKFFDLLVENRAWLKTSTLAEAIAEVPPTGSIYLPDSSYREMTEWALPVRQQLEYERVVRSMQDDDRWPSVKRFVRGGNWRNFKVKYSEANELYARMMNVSRRLDQARRDGATGDLINQARRALYRGQCNCSYWHGAFGGIYLPHLRNALYRQLIAADNLLDQALERHGPRITATVDDYNFDARQEVRLENDKLICWLAPTAGGQMYELDVRPICHNLLASMTRRPESYHELVQAGDGSEGGAVASIHGRVHFKTPGLDQQLHYDAAPRKSLLDHFYDEHVSLEEVSRGKAREQGDFLHGIYEAKVRRNPDRIQVQLSRQGAVDGQPLRITKAVTAEAGSSTLEVAYLLEGLSQDHPLHFSVEWNFAGLPAGADDRYFYRGSGERLGQLGSRLDLRDAQELGLVDEWLGVDLRLGWNRPTHIWTYPVETVSQSEGGFEAVHQSVAVQPHWIVRGDTDGRWSVTMQLVVDTSRKESQMPAIEAVSS